MSGHKPFRRLNEQLRSTPEGAAAIRREEEIVRDLLKLHRLREARGVTQVDLARAWDTSQTNVSRVEHERDIYLSTLRGYVEALGGHIEINAVFPDQTIRLGSEEGSTSIQLTA